MSETNIAYVILIAAHIFFMPFLFLISIMSSHSQTGSFKKDYAMAFKAYHLICFVALGLASAIFGVFWAVEVLLK